MEHELKFQHSICDVPVGHAGRGSCVDNLENSAEATGLEKVFIPITKKGNPKECSNYHTIALISHASKVMLKIL